MTSVEGPKSLKINRAITSPRLKVSLFVVEALNSLSTTTFFFYVYFLMKHRYGFGTLQNLTLAAVLGFAYALMGTVSGRLAQKYGSLVTLRCGILLMIGAFALETQATAMPIVVGLMLVANIGVCISWPPIVALISEGEPPGRLQSLLGTYNVIWALCAACSYFNGGAMIERLGWNSLFLIPAGLQCIELGIVLWLQKQVRHQPTGLPKFKEPAVPITHQSLRSPIPSQAFLKMGWLANPFGYLAINTVVSVAPTLSVKFGLSTAQTGFLCSIWLFARAAAFLLLWVWPNWHYRFRYLAGAFVSLTISLIIILLTPYLWTLIAAELFMGLSLGLFYYSSLFYSMDAGEKKAEHGGIHEAVIGAGWFMGPAIAACGLRFFPTYPSSGAWAVTVLLMGGLSGLYWLRYRRYQ